MGSDKGGKNGNADIRPPGYRHEPRRLRSGYEDVPGGIQGGPPSFGPCPKNDLGQPRGYD